MCVSYIFVIRTNGNAGKYSQTNETCKMQICVCCISDIKPLRKFNKFIIHLLVRSWHVCVDAFFKEMRPLLFMQKTFQKKKLHFFSTLGLIPLTILGPKIGVDKSRINSQVSPVKQIKKRETFRPIRIQ